MKYIMFIIGLIAILNQNILGQILPIDVSFSVSNYSCIDTSELLVLSIRFENVTNKDFAIWLQNWRGYEILQKNMKLDGAPYTINHVNHLFFAKEQLSLSEIFTQLEYTSLNKKLFANAFYIIKSNKVLDINILINDKEIIDLIKQQSCYVNYIYSVCKFNNLKNILKGQKGEGLYYEHDSILIPYELIISNGRKNFDVTFNREKNTYDVYLSDINKIFTKYIKENHLIIMNKN